MLLDRFGMEATPQARSECPGCSGRLVAKCGPIVTWHWAHETADCDPWAEPESQWHIDWKHRLAALGAAIEVVMPPHRADAVLPSGQIVELQAGYLSADDILAREGFYGDRLSWVYRCHWGDRLHHGRHGFWWKNGAKSMTTHRRPVWWDMGNELIRVSLGLVDVDDQYGFAAGQRVLGRVHEREPW